MTLAAPEDARAREALRAAQLYYQQQATMEAIARELGTSRSTVSRLLAHARDTGLVQISIHPPRDLAARLARAVRRRYGVTTHIVPVDERTADVDRLERVALTAARMLAPLVDSNMTIGVAWGATVSAVGRHLTSTPTHNSHIVQLNGAANVLTSGVPYAGEILGRFGAAFTAEVHHFPVPALFDDPATKRALWRERSIRRLLDMQARCSLAVFGLGSPQAAVPSHIYSRDYFDPADHAALAADGVVGDLATVFFRADGSSDGIGLNDRTSGPDLEVVRRIPRRFCIVSGASKLDALRGALTARLITDLVIDESTARRLVEDEEE